VAKSGGRAIGTRKRFLVDPRFAIGLGLVIVGVAGTAFVVTSSDTSQQVFTARGPLSIGDVIVEADLARSSVRVGGAERLYLVPGDVPDTGLVVTRAVAAGELVPASAVGTTTGQESTTVVVPVGERLSASVKAGATVDLWASPQLEGGAFGPPVVIVPSASVVRLLEESGIVVDETSAAVEVLVPKYRIARVLEAIANDDALSLVPVSLAVKG
jgi:hypothetical protein